MKTETKQENEQKTKPLDLEIKDAQLIFDGVWNELVRKRGLDGLRFPKEIFWLNGAPGAGKGTQTRLIMESKDLTAPPIVVSDLLTSAEAKRLKDAGLMVGDKEVTSLLLNKLLEPENQSGVVVDGYPRTKVQVECLKLFYQKLNELRRDYHGTIQHGDFPKPNFHIIVLYVEERVSVERQLHRGRMQQEELEKQEQNPEAKPVVHEVRKTDLDPAAARNRYRTFKEVTYPALASLREVFHYHFINATESIAKVQERIVEELKYQSSLELEPETYDFISRIPIAQSITVHARQDLVKRLDGYSNQHAERFRRIVDHIETKFMPIVLRHAISGLAYISSEDPLFEEPMALAMVIDVFSERGFHAVADIRKHEVPCSVDLQTGEIKTKRRRVYRFRIEFPGSEIRRGR